ncbi:hypothetical protein C8J56DRAFT_799571 [Mycena floridula]|nr:hypothetical protein C8J56DRAFT_799571 [Mycena floridula]
MPSDLYNILGIPQDAPQEQVRRAYKKMALKTHPDRLPPSATPSEKAAADESFRKVNNAYEVLNDPRTRQEYDRHGVWPPPEPAMAPERPPRSARSHHSSHSRHHSRSPFQNPFFDSPSRDFHFTDPFVLFESIFGDLHREFNRHQWPDDPHSRLHSNIGNMMANMERDMFSGFGTGFPFMSPFGGFPAMTAGTSGGGGRYMSQSVMSQTINGVTHTIEKKRDWDGNEHVIRTYPDGRIVRTVNGVEQQDQRYLPPASSPPPEPRHHHDHVPRQITHSSSYQLPPPPPYSNSGGFGQYSLVQVTYLLTNVSSSSFGTLQGSFGRS